MSSERRRFLLVEDDNVKETQITAVILEYRPQVHIEVARSVAEAVAKLSGRVFDLIVLDIALPSHARSLGAASSQMPSGGLEVIYELSADARLDPVVVLTQYPAIEYNGCSFKLAAAARVLRSEAGANILSVNYFDRNEQRWKNHLREAMDKIA